MVNCFWKNFCLNPNLSFAAQATLFLHINYQVLIPMCHPLALTAVDVAFSEVLEPDAQGCVGIRVLTTAICVGQTGVEMEALCAASAALLTIYDMCKAIDRGMRIENVQLDEKRGGKSGVWRREGASSKGAR